MKRTTILILTALFQLTLAFSQSQLSTDSSVKVFPHWKKGESHGLIISSKTDDFSNSKTNKYVTTFDAAFTVLEKDTSGYVVEWVYTKSTLAAGEVTLENCILAEMLNTKFAVRLSLTGRFKELVNAEDVKIAADKAVDKLISGSSNNPTMNIQFKGAKQLIDTKQGLEIALLKHVKFYNLSFGYLYKTNKSQINKLKMPNALGGQPFDATEKVTLTTLDNRKNICVIETVKSVDNAILKNDVVEYLKKVSPKDGKAIEDEIGKEQLEYTESSVQQLDFTKGLVQKGSFTRKMNFGFQNRTTVLEIQTNE